MGYMAYHAIVVTSIELPMLEKLKLEAEKFGLQVLGPGKPVTNLTHTMLICPDGSKEGWEESQKGDMARSFLIDWMNRTRFEDGSSILHWAEVRYGGDEPHLAEVLNHSGKVPS